MRMLMLIGGVLGFSLGLVFGYVGRADWPSTLWHGCVASAGLGLLMRWWGRVWVRSLQRSLSERQLAEAIARQKSPSTSPTKP